MCLTIHRNRTNHFKRKYVNPEETLKVYKIVERLQESGSLMTPWRGAKVILGEELTSVKCYDVDKALNTYREISGGVIHCFRDLQTAIENVCCKNEIIIECYSKVKDFIAIGFHGDICFTKIFVTNKVLYSNFHLHEDISSASN